VAYRSFGSTCSPISFSPSIGSSNNLIESSVSPSDAARLAPYADFIVPDPSVWSAPGGIEAALAPYVEALAG